ncbi:prothymosin alpha-A [Mobula hypostoma]|uniref:prothymosin alpha-A n=2 Tax=Mobula TaxID=86365 RepID=UPI002FC3AC82
MRESRQRAPHSVCEPYLHCLQVPAAAVTAVAPCSSSQSRSSCITTDSAFKLFSLFPPTFKRVFATGIMSESTVEKSVERSPKDLKKTQEVEPENGKGDAPANGNAENEENGEQEVEENADEVEDEESEDVGEDDEEEEDEEDEEGDEDECEGAAEKRVAEDEEDDVAKKKQKTDDE